MSDSPSQFSTAVPAGRDLVEAVVQSKLERDLFGLGEPVRLGRYVLLEHLGSGGFGTVHAAYDPKLDRKVALKLLQKPDGRAVQRMLREAQALARVAHPNVVAVYDVGTYRDVGGEEQVYIAMEYVDGTTLRQWLATKRSWSDVLATMIAAGRGLEAIHRAGLVHLDFKPGNVLVDRDGRVRVVDFGLARLTARDAEVHDAKLQALRTDSSMTERTGELVMGTPPYMAPEQHLAHGVDSRADMFAFAVTVFEALYGTRPHTGSTPAELLDAKRRERIVDAPHRGAPVRLRAVVRKALSAAPEHRHTDMSVLLAALERRPGRRWLAGLALVVAATAGGAAVFEHQRRTAVVMDEVEAQTRAARDAAARALFVYPRVDAPDEPTAYQHVRALEQLERSDAVARAGELRLEFADTLVRLGDRYWDLNGGRAFALDYYIAALIFAPDDDRANERATISPGRLAALESQSETAEFSPAQLQATEPLIALASADDAERDSAVVELLARPSLVATVRDDLEKVLESSDGPRRKRRAPDERVAPEADRSTADVKPAANDEVASPPEPSASEEPASADARDPSAARAEVAKARARLAAGDWSAAEQAFHRALELDRKCVPALAELASLYFELRYYRKARDMARKAVKLAPRDPALRIALGDAAFRLQSYAEARRAYESAVAMGSAEAKRRLDTMATVVGPIPPPR